jgi:hypothetical protein
MKNMKKIILINVLTMLTLTAFCQNAKTANTNVPKEMMINGIPYSQYKAQQDALRQTSPQPVDNNLNATPVKPGTNRTTAPAKTQTAQPLIHEAEKASSNVNASKTNATPESKVVAPAIQMIPAGDFKSSPLTPTPVGATPIASKTIVPTTYGGPLVAAPVVNLTTGSGNADAKQTAPATNAPQQVIAEAKPAQIQEVPNSVVSPTPKLPVVPNQSNEKSGKNN